MPLGSSLIGMTGEILSALPGASRLVERRRPKIAERHVDVAESRLLLRPLPKRLQRALAEWRAAASGEEVQRYFAARQLRCALEHGAHEAIRAYFALYGPKDLNCLRLAFTVRNRTAREASFLHNVSLVCNPVEFTSQGGKAGLTPMQDNNTRIPRPFRLDNVLMR
jgi:hypothetical protein